MALIQQMDSPPVFCDNTSYSAGPLRRLLGRMVGNAVGIFGTTDFGVTLSGSTVSVSLARAALPAPVGEVGVYLVETTGTATLTLDPADATRDRRDVLVAYAVPPATGADVGKWFLEIVKGDPATGAAPTVANALLLREFLVPSAAAGTQPTSTDKRYAQAQQYISGPSLYGAEQPSINRPGQLWTSNATRETWVYNGSGWARVSGIRDVANTSEVIAPYAHQIVYDRTVGVLKRYTGSAWVRYTSGDPADPAPRGRVARVRNDSSTGDITALTLIDQSVNLSLIGGRRYKITFFCAYDQVSPPYPHLGVRVQSGASITVAGSAWVNPPMNVDSTGLSRPFTYIDDYVPAITGTYSFATAGQANGSTLRVYARYFLIEDIGV